MADALPFCWLGRVLNGSFAHERLTIRIWLREPIDSLPESVVAARPRLLDTQLVDGQLVSVSTGNQQLPKAIKSRYGKARTPKPRRVAEVDQKSTRAVLDGWSKASPWDRFWVELEGWLVMLHEHHAIAVAVVDWYDWYASHSQPEPSTWHRRSVAAPPEDAWPSLAAAVDTDPQPASRERRELVTSALYFLTDKRELVARFASDGALQRLAAHAWTPRDNGRTLALLAAALPDDALTAIAAHGYSGLVLGRGLGLGDVHGVRGFSTPNNAVWAIQERQRLFYLRSPMHPKLWFDERRGFLLSVEDWGIVAAPVESPVSDVTVASVFADFYSRLIERRQSPRKPEEAKFIERCESEISRVLAGRIVDGELRWS